MAEGNGLDEVVRIGKLRKALRKEMVEVARSVATDVRQGICPICKKQLPITIRGDRLEAMKKAGLVCRCDEKKKNGC